MAPTDGQPATAAGADSLEQGEVNARLWAEGDHVSRYANRTLRPVEAVILARYRDQLGGRVLELGCGAGRLLGYLLALGGDVHGIDISPKMVAHCRREYPQAKVEVRDIRTLDELVAGSFTAIWVPDNTLDVFDDGERGSVLVKARELLGPDGVLIFSSHNLAHADGDGAPRGRPSGPSRARRMLTMVAQLSLADLARVALRWPVRWRNQRRLRPLQYRTESYAIFNDVEADYGVLHYYIRRHDQERQLLQLGYEPIDCLDVDGRSLAPGEPGQGPWLQYVASPRR